MSVNVSGSAANNYANITHAMYQDWLERFYPQQKQLLEQTQNGELLTQQLGAWEPIFRARNRVRVLRMLTKWHVLGLG